MKSSLYATTKSLIVELKMTIENHNTIALINDELINRMTIKLIQRIQKYITNNCKIKTIKNELCMLKKFEVHTKHKLIEKTSFLEIKNIKEYIILKNQWKQNIAKSITNCDTTKALKSQTIHFLVYRNLIQKKLRISTTIIYQNIENFNKVIKDDELISKTKIWQEYKETLNVLS